MNPAPHASDTVERSRPTSSDPAEAHFRSPLPRGLRDVAHALSWDNFYATYACAGGIRLGSWSATPGRGGLTDYQATIAVGDRIWSLRESSTGPIGAVTAMLHALGTPIEIVSLHHQRTVDGYAGFVLCDVRGISSWGLGVDETSEAAYAKAMISAVNRFG
ncbi:hypothetical protein [Williamsia maris]|uniref:Homocitrate synthase n=1 Tax=Williamsia maris TaxID=72806 RepID=A0ABT1HAU0_9NOCA|nr:hypothetical protein [Williamsia maris]MCP2175372.1 hypothetical protein [Williamsia maris]